MSALGDTGNAEIQTVTAGLQSNVSTFTLTFNADGEPCYDDCDLVGFAV